MGCPLIGMGLMRVGSWILGEEDHINKISFSSYLIKGTYYQYDTIVDVDLDHLSEVIFLRFSPVQ